MSRLYLIGLLSGTLLLSGGVAATRPSPEPVPEPAFADELAKEIAEATPIEVGVMTDRQRVHSALFPGYDLLYGYRRIPELVAKIPSNDMVMGDPIGCGPERPEGVTSEAIAPEAFFNQLAGESEVILEGMVQSKSSQLTNDEAYIFTDYEVQITEVIKSSSAGAPNPGARITITRPGGRVILNGKFVKAMASEYGLLPVGSMEVLFFLKYVPETGAYRDVQHDSIFEARDGFYYPLTNLIPEGLFNDPERLRNAINALGDNQSTRN
jgi:hypothetical protein